MKIDNIWKQKFKANKKWMVIILGKNAISARV